MTNDNIAARKIMEAADFIAATGATPDVRAWDHLVAYLPKDQTKYEYVQDVLRRLNDGGISLNCCAKLILAGIAQTPDISKRPFAFAVRRAPENGPDQWRLFMDEGEARAEAEQLDGDYEALFRVGDRRSAIAALQAPADSDAVWRPITTAPRDGTWFLACATEKGWGATRVVRFSEPDDRLPIHGEGEMWPSPPTHWMPLPNPPVNAALTAPAAKAPAVIEADVGRIVEEHLDSHTFEKNDDGSIVIDRAGMILTMSEDKRLIQSAAQGGGTEYESDGGVEGHAQSHALRQPLKYNRCGNRKPEGAAPEGFGASKDEPAGIKPGPSDDDQGCEHCGDHFPIETMTMMEDHWICPTCYTKWKETFDACEHSWEPYTSHSSGDEGRYCSKCCCFEANPSDPPSQEASAPPIAGGR